MTFHEWLDAVHERCTERMMEYADPYTHVMVHSGEPDVIAWLVSWAEEDKRTLWGMQVITPHTHLGPSDEHNVLDLTEEPALPLPPLSEALEQCSVYVEVNPGIHVRCGLLTNAEHSHHRVQFRRDNTNVIVTQETP